MPINEYRPDVDGIRALAVLSVFIYHLSPDLLPGGFLGVDIFFVISGYLITGIIVRENHLQTFSFRHFYARRVKRIFPALFVMLLISGLVATLSLIPETYLTFIKSARYASGQLANLFFARKVDYFAEGFSQQPLLNTWSLGVEEQFYLFWPLIIFACFRLLSTSDPKRINSTASHSSNLSTSIKNNPNFSCNNASALNSSVIRVTTAFLFIFLVSFALCYVLAEANYNLAFYMFYSRAFEFCIGGFLSLGILPRPITRVANGLFGALGLLLIFYSLCFVGHEYSGRSFLQLGILIPCIGAAIIIHADWKIGIINKALATRIPVAIGKISYSLYLYHWPVIAFWKLYSNTSDFGRVDVFAIIVLTFFLSILSYYLVERPARQSRMSDTHILFVAVGLIAGFALVFKHMEIYETASWRVVQYVNVPTTETSGYDPGCTEIREQGILVYECQSLRTTGKRFIALIGDSHAWHYLRPVTAWARENGYNVKFLGVPACPMLIGEISIISSVAEADGDKCAVAMAPLQRQIIDDPNVEFILIAQRFDLFYDGKNYSDTTRSITFRESDRSVVKDHTGYYRGGLAYTINVILKAGKVPVLLKQVPVLGSYNSCNWKPFIKMFFEQKRSCEFDIDFIEKWQRPSIDFVDEFITDHQIAFFDPMPYFLNPLIDGSNIYKDRDHLNLGGALMLTPHFDRAMDMIADQTRKRMERRIP